MCAIQPGGNGDPAVAAVAAEEAAAVPEVKTEVNGDSDCVVAGGAVERRGDLSSSHDGDWTRRLDDDRVVWKEKPRGREGRWGQKAQKAIQKKQYEIDRLL